MDKKLKYENALLDFLKEYAPIVPYGWKNVRHQIVVDSKNGHYPLVRVGWHDDQRIHYIVFHFDIIDDKVWVQQNRTDLPIVEELADFGIPSADLIGGSWRTSIREQLLAAA